MTLNICLGFSLHAEESKNDITKITSDGSIKLFQNEKYYDFNDNVKIRSGTGNDLAIFINKSSPKWSELKGGIALQTYWASTQVQYRMSVSSIEIDKKIINESWQLRPDIPKKMDWIYKNSFQQSSEVQDLDQLRAEIDKIKNVDDLTATDQATGLILKPEVIERLNLDTEDGIHDRRLYLKEEQHWIEKQLVP